MAMTFIMLEQLDIKLCVVRKILMYDINIVTVLVSLCDVTEY